MAHGGVADSPRQLLSWGGACLGSVETTIEGLWFTIQSWDWYMGVFLLGFTKIWCCYVGGICSIVFFFFLVYNRVEWFIFFFSFFTKRDWCWGWFAFGFSLFLAFSSSLAWNTSLFIGGERRERGSPEHGLWLLIHLGKISYVGHKPTTWSYKTRL